MSFEKEALSSWKTVPRKDQLAILTLCRIVDFFQMTSFQTICYYQLKSFDGSRSEQDLSWQTGVALASFTASQSCTAILWGYIADKVWVGRKNALLVGLLGTCMCCICVAFSQSFVWMVVFRIIGGLLNGTVGVVRTMISEVIIHKKHQARAFLLLPASFSIAAIIGPVSAGWLSGLAITENKVVVSSEWLKQHPFGLPSILSAILLALTSLIVYMRLNETLADYKAISIFQQFRRFFDRARDSDTSARGDYFLLSSIRRNPVKDDPIESELLFNVPVSRPTLPFRRIWTYNVVLTMISLAFFEFHLGAFGSIWPLLLSSPRQKSNSNSPEAFNMAGGLGMSPQSLGYTSALAGGIGLILQILLYPSVHRRLGTLRCFQLFLLLFPVVYVVSPFLVAISGQSVETRDAAVWAGIALLLFAHSTSRIFCIPASITLLNNCSPHPSVLGIVHGIGQSTSAAFRTIGPICAAYLYGIGYAENSIGISWWVVSAIAAAGWAASLVIREGSGHEIILEGEQDLDSISHV